MKSTIDSAKKPKKGRPPVDTEAVNVRFRTEVLGVIDEWCAAQRPIPTRPEAIRRLVEQSLSKPKK